ncbi:MAG: IS1380 family transposase [Actinomycetota bacterium]|nr:IS1380 family transposase [Actinomycetota bacterium]
MKATALAFELDDHLVTRPFPAVAHPVVETSEDSVTGVAGIALWGELLDHLGLVGESDRRGLRLIGPGGYTGGECYRAVVETQLAGGDFLSDRSLLADEATQRLRGSHTLASHTTLWRFCAGADLGRAAKAAAVNRAMLGRAWAMGGAPPPGLLTIDPDATWISTYGPNKEGSAFSYKHEVGMSPMLGVCGETGDVLALRARGGNANAGRGLGSFIDECVSAIPAGCRDDYQLWVRVDSAGYRADVVEAAERHDAAFTVTARGYTNVRAAIEALATDPTTTWAPAVGAEEAKGSEVAETMFGFAGRDLRMIVRRQPLRPGDQLSFDDLGGWRFHAIITNIAPLLGSAADVEHHHRLRGGAPEEAIRQLKEDFGLCHAPLENFFGNWLWWQAAALAYNVARWVRVLALPPAFRTCRGKRLRLAFFNVAARVVRSGRRLFLRLPRAYAHAGAFIEALARLRRLPVFA